MSINNPVPLSSIASQDKSQVNLFSYFGLVSMTVTSRTYQLLPIRGSTGYHTHDLPKKAIFDEMCLDFFFVLVKRDR